LISPHPPRTWNNFVFPRTTRLKLENIGNKLCIKDVTNLQETAKTPDSLRVLGGISSDGVSFFMISVGAP
jgi:hypothetical protein